MQKIIDIRLCYLLGAKIIIAYYFHQAAWRGLFKTIIFKAIHGYKALITRIPFFPNYLTFRLRDVRNNNNSNNKIKFQYYYEQRVIRIVFQ